jgi:hypothetical protein
MKEKRRIKPRLHACLMRLITVLSLTLILDAAPGAVTNGPAKSQKDTRLANVPLEEIAADFRKIRKIKGHFDGGKWNPEVDRWMGRKHRLMIELGLRLSKGKYRKNDIGKLMDPPDQMVKEGHDLFRLITGQPGYDSLTAGSCEFLVYYWRGKHDFLFFTCDNNRIVNSGWWYAGE